MFDIRKNIDSAQHGATVVVVVVATAATATAVVHQRHGGNKLCAGRKVSPRDTKLDHRCVVIVVVNLSVDQYAFARVLYDARLGNYGFACVSQYLVKLEMR